MQVLGRGVGAVRDGLQHVHFPLGNGGQHLDEQVCFGWEVAIDRADGHAGRRCDVADLCLAPAALGNHHPGRSEYQRALVGQAGLDLFGFAVGHEEMNLNSLME